MSDQPFTLTHLLARVWWLVLLRGVAAILFGILALAWPHLTLAVLIVLYAIYAFGDGVFALAAAVRGGGVFPRWWLALVGVTGLACGVVAVIWPGMTAIVLAILIGAAAVARGALEIIGAIQMRKVIDNEWALILSGAISVLFGLAVMIAPRAGALALVWLIAIWAVAFGVLTVGLSLRLRRLRAA